MAVPEEGQVAGAPLLRAEQEFLAKVLMAGRSHLVPTDPVVEVVLAVRGLLAVHRETVVLVSRIRSLAPHSSMPVVVEVLRSTALPRDWVAPAVAVMLLFRLRVSRELPTLVVVEEAAGTLAPQDLQEAVVGRE
jgi:alpha-D-ribose 1-methylphosphonate 5-triphosphate synthase subunit PhnL